MWHILYLLKKDLVELIKHVSLVKTVMFKGHSNSEWMMKNFFSQSSGDEMVKVMFFFLCFAFGALVFEMLSLYFSILWLCYFEKLQYND